MKKILILTNSISGLYNFRRELIEKLLIENFDIIIATPHGTKENYFDKLGCKIIETKINGRSINPISEFVLLKRYFKIIKKNKPDVVLTYTIKPNIYGGIVCRLLKIPYIANITGLGTAVENKSILQKISIILYKIALKKANCIFFQNEENKFFMLKRKIVKQKYRLIPGSGVNLAHFNVLEYPVNKTINFLFISRILKEKGIEQYLEAASYIKKKYPNTMFHVLGRCDNESYKNILKELNDNKTIIYHGNVDDVRKYHEFSHCTVHPSFYPEGMSNVLLESAACGRPIITTDRSGCKEVVVDGVNGFIVKQKNIKDLIEKIEQFLNLDYETQKKMGLEGRKIVEKSFDRDIVIKAYIEEIYNVLKEKRVYGLWR